MHLHVSALILLASVRGQHSVGIGEDRKHGPGISEKRKIIGSLIHVPSATSEEQLIEGRKEGRRKASSNGKSCQFSL